MRGMEEVEIDVDHKSIRRRPYVIGAIIVLVIALLITWSRVQERARLVAVWSPSCRANPQCLQSVKHASDTCHGKYVRVFEPKRYNLKSERRRYTGCVREGVWQMAQFKIEEPAELSLNHAISLAIH